MALFKIVGVDERGERTALELVGGSEADVRTEAQRRGISVVMCKLLSSGAGGGAATQRKLTNNQVWMFCERLSPLLEMKIALREALNFVSMKAPDSGLRAVAAELHALTENMSLADAVVATRKFPAIVEGCIKVGGEAADVSRILSVMARFYRVQVSLVRSVRSALIQPTIALAIIIGFVVFSLFVVVPRIAAILESFRYKPGGLLAFQMWIAKFATTFWPLVLIGAIGLAVLLFRDNPFRRVLIEYVVSRLPMVRAVVYGLRQTSLLYAMAVLFRAGIPQRQVLEHLVEVARGTMFEDQMKAALADHERQGQFSKALKNHVNLDPEIIFCIEIGERTASLDTQAERLAGIYERETSLAAEGLTARLTPVIVIVCAVIAVLSYLSTFGSLLWVCNKLMRSGA